MPRYVPGSAKHDDLVVDHYAALTTAFARSLTNSFDLWPLVVLQVKLEQVAEVRLGGVIVAAEDVQMAPVDDCPQKGRENVTMLRDLPQN